MTDVAFGATGATLDQGGNANNQPLAPTGVTSSSTLIEMLAVASNVTQTATSGYTGKYQENGGAPPALFVGYKNRAAGTESGNAQSMATGSGLAGSTGVCFRLENVKAGDPFGPTRDYQSGNTTTIPSCTLSSLSNGQMLLYAVAFSASRTFTGPGGSWVRITANASQKLHVFYLVVSTSSVTVSGLTYTSATANAAMLMRVDNVGANVDGSVVRSGVRTPIAASVIISGVRQPATVSVIRSGVRTPVV